MSEQKEMTAREVLEAADPVYTQLMLGQLPSEVEIEAIMQDTVSFPDAGKIVMVDDDLDVFKAYVIPLIIATRGKAAFILEGESDKNRLIERIKQCEPDVVLVDGRMQQSTGVAVIAELREQRIGARHIYFTSDIDPHKVKYFPEKGIRCVVLKNKYVVDMTLEKLRNALEEKERENCTLVYGERGRQVIGKQA